MTRIARHEQVFLIVNNKDSYGASCAFIGVNGI